MPDLHSLPPNWHPPHAIRNNGPSSLTLERHKLRELAEGWPLYRDACEWENLTSIFHPDAYIYTTWTGRTHHADFIAASKAGMDRGAFIMHRVHGSTTDINVEGTRAVTKMKATITQRFEGLECLDLAAFATTSAAAGGAGGGVGGERDGAGDAGSAGKREGGATCEADAESDCRFLFFWAKEPDTRNDGAVNELAGQWRARSVRHWYEKDKLIPVDPSKVPKLDDEKLKKYPVGCRYLAYCQEQTMGVKVLLDLPGHRREGASVNGRKHDLLYQQAKDWVEGREIQF